MSAINEIVVQKMDPKLKGFTYNSLTKFYKNFIDLDLSYICCFPDTRVGPNRLSTLSQKKRAEVGKLIEELSQCIEKHHKNAKFELKDLIKIIGEGDHSADPLVWWKNTGIDTPCYHSLQGKSSLWQQISNIFVCRRDFYKQR